MSHDILPSRAAELLKSEKLEQNKLDIRVRSRTSRLPWRGQFSPELIEYLIERTCPKADVVFDPFCGSGTVLFEVAQRGGYGIGTEINPAAWHLASLVSFCSLTAKRQAEVRRELSTLREETIREGDLFSHPSARTDVLAVLNAPAVDPMLRACLAAAVLLGMGDRPAQTKEALTRGLAAVEALLTELTAYPGTGTCHLSDARSTLLDAGSVEAVITSPPYINVFNYHQNYRPAAELLGWQPLEAARSEIGANRKHRANRFLTVIQYCLDMVQTLNEIARVCKPDAPVVFVIGRESNVLGTAFYNGEILKQLMQYNPGPFEVRESAERAFTNRFGQRIYEDIIVGRCVGETSIAIDHARSIGMNALATASGRVPGVNRATLNTAKASASDIKPSILLTLSLPSILTINSKGGGTSMQVSHPKTHGDKLMALCANRGLPSADKSRVEAAVERYVTWIATMQSVEKEGEALLKTLVNALNGYKNFVDLDLIYDSKENFLYRQNGQIKLSNSVLEEFLPYLFDVRLVPGFRRLTNVRCGPQASFAGLSFGSPFVALNAGGVFLKSKDQDFAVAKTHRITITDGVDGGDVFTSQFCVSHFATEIKTNLDKTMFQEASQSANELKRAVPGSRCVLLCEYLDMTPITTKLTSIDEVIVLRKAKRLSSNIRSQFRTTQGRRDFRSTYLDFLQENPLHTSSFERFVHHLNECFPEQGDDTVEAVLGRGYF